MSFMQRRFVGFFGVYSGCCSVEIVLFFLFFTGAQTELLQASAAEFIDGTQDYVLMSKDAQTLPAEMAQVCENESPAMADGSSSLSSALLCQCLCVYCKHTVTKQDKRFMCIYTRDFYECIYGCVECFVAVVLRVCRRMLSYNLLRTVFKTSIRKICTIIYINRSDC